MDVTIRRADCTEFETPLLALHLFEGAAVPEGPAAKVDEAMGGRISALIEAGDFRGKEGEMLLLFPDGKVPAERVLLVGTGKREKLDRERLRRAAAVAVKEAAKRRISRVASILHHAEMADEEISPEDAAQSVAEGAVLAGYRFDEMKSAPGEDDEPPAEVGEYAILEKLEEKAARLEEGARVGAAVARGQSLARTLGNLPGNVATPTYLAETAERIARDTGMKATILGRKELEKEGMHALLAVAQGTDQEPKLIVLEHRKGPEGQRPIALVGKGLTFDAGGISIKPSAGMEQMKFDMSGGGAVLGAMQAIGELELPINVVAIVPSSENLLSGAAVKPGDVIQTHLGKTVEVINTDAEGRLILCDALSYLRRFEPVAAVDAATLTGAVVIGLGHHTIGLMGNDEALIEEVRAAGERAGERAWPLPMFDEYREQLKSDYADLKNVGGRPAGTITAGWFLREFVEGFPWAHLDVAGTAYGDGKLPYQIKGSTGVPVRLFVEWVRGRAA
jgi:leucyl aminopeptidase